MHFITFTGSVTSYSIAEVIKLLGRFQRPDLNTCHSSSAIPGDLLAFSRPVHGVVFLNCQFKYHEKQVFNVT